jgi:predicted transcriptional regulator
MKPKYLRVQEADGLFRDSETGAVVNLDNSAYIKHKQSKEFAKKKAEEERRKESRLNNLEQDVKTLKEGINQILELLKHGS